MARTGKAINWSFEFEEKFLDVVVRCRGVVRHAAKAVGIGHSSVYCHANADEDFGKRLEVAKRVGAQILEDVCFDDVLNGVLEPVFSGGEQAVDCHGNPAFIRRIPWGPRMAMLGAAFPDKYGKQRHELSGPGGGPISTNAQVHIYLPDNGRKPQGDGNPVEQKPETAGAANAQ